MGSDDGAYPRLNGATTRQPASTSNGATFRHRWAVSGKPCRHNAIGASAGPHDRTRSCTAGVATSMVSGSSIRTGSNSEISQRSWTTFSIVTRTLDAVSEGGSWPTTTVWLTKTSTTACFGSADTDAAAGTDATAEICFCLAPGITTSLISEVYESRNSPVSRSRAELSCCSTVSGLYDNILMVLSLAAAIESIAGEGFCSEATGGSAP